MNAAVDLQIASAAAGIPAAADFRRWVSAALGDAAEPVELTVRVVDEAEARELNRRYRGRDYATNVLSFPAELPPGVDLPLLGDLVLCAPVVAREAAGQGKPEAHHWAHLTVHGVLHLLGEDHQTDAEAERMEAAERRILARFGVPDPYAEESAPVPGP